MTSQPARPPRRPTAWRAMKAPAAAIQFTDIGPDDPWLAADILPVLRELRPHVTAGSLTSIYAEGHPPGTTVHRRLPRRRMPCRSRLEWGRLDEPAGQLEFARTRQIIARHLPPPGGR